MKYDVAVIGGGPAGMIVAGKAGEAGARAVLIEKNNSLGKKLLITGKGRCNITQAKFNGRDLADKFGKEGRFLLYGFSVFAPKQVVDFFEKLKLKTKTERGGRIFPKSDRAEDVSRALKSYLDRNGVKILIGKTVKKIIKKKIINYQYKWKLEEAKIKDLVLDINNVRLGAEHESQDEIINDLFLNEEAMSILESIHQIGYFPDEPPVVVKEKGEFVVLDGNRRVVSLKAMLSPAIAPSRYISKIEKLMKEFQLIDNIFVHVATSRDEAMEYLAAKHTKTTRKAWSALRRAYFYYAQKDQGQSVEKLIERYKGVDIPSYIKMYEMHNVALSLKNTSQETRNKIVNKRTFPISTLERFYSDKYVQEKLGIDFNKVTGEAKVPSGLDFDRVYSRVITDIVSKIATSRKELSKEDDRKKYLDSVTNEVLGKEIIGKEKKRSASAFKQLKKDSVKKKDFLVPKKIDSPFDSAGIGRVLWELQTIDYVKFPNATADLLRTFLEISIKKYLEETNSLPTPRRNGGFIFLDDVLKKIKSDLQTVFNHRLVQVISEIQKNKWYLDSINHNPDVFAVETRVKDAWDQIQPLIKHIFDEYKKQTDSKNNYEILFTIKIPRRQK